MGAGKEANLPLDNCRYNEYYALGTTPEVGHDGYPQKRPTRSREPRLAGLAFHLFVCRLLRSQACAVPHAAGDERRPSCRRRWVVSPDGRDGSVKIRQDNELYATVLTAGETVKHELKKDRHAYVQVARGSVKLNGTKLDAGDGAAISAEKTVELTGVENTEVLLFDLA